MADPTPIAKVATIHADPKGTGILYRDGAHRYIVWADGCNDSVPGRWLVTEFGTRFRVVRRLKR